VEATGSKEGAAPPSPLQRKRGKVKAQVKAQDGSKVRAQPI